MTEQTPGGQGEVLHRPRRWPWIIGIVAALAIGVGIGVASTDEPEPEIVTKEVEVESQDLRDQITALEEELAAAEAAAIEPPAGESSDEEPASTEIGDTVTITELDEEIGTITVSDPQIETTAQVEYGEAPKHGYFLVFSVDLTASATLDVYEDDFYIVLDDGTRIDQGDGNAWDAVDYDDMLGYATVNAGEKRSGLLVFDVPVKHGQLAYAPNWDGGPITTWAF